MRSNEFLMVSFYFCCFCKYFVTLSSTAASSSKHVVTSSRVWLSLIFHYVSELMGDSPEQRAGGSPISFWVPLLLLSLKNQNVSGQSGISLICTLVSKHV